jgi:transcriptional regulator with XRE-family HTH domain
MGHRIEPQIAFGEAVKMVLDEKGLKRSVVAARAGVSDRFLYEVEAGKSNPTLATLRRVSLGLRVSLTELMAKVELAERKATRARRRDCMAERQSGMGSSASRRVLST